MQHQHTYYSEDEYYNQSLPPPLVYASDYSNYSIQPPRVELTVSSENQPYGRFIVRYGSDISVVCRCTNAANTFNLGPFIKHVNIREVANSMRHLGAWCNEEHFPMCIFRLSCNMHCLRNVYMNNVVRLKDEHLAERKRSIQQTSAILLFPSGVAISTGAVDEDMALLNASRYCYMVSQYCGLPAQISNFKLTNQVIICNLPFNLDLNKLARGELSAYVTYNPPDQVMAVVRLAMYSGASILENGCPTALISANGSINLAGLVRKYDAVPYLEIIMPHLLACRSEADGGNYYKTADQREVEIQQMQNDSASYTWAMFRESWNANFENTDVDAMQILASHIGEELGEQLFNFTEDDVLSDEELDVML